jgi:hypothetical protein
VIVATKLVVRFSGLCGFASRLKQVEVLCHPEGQAHTPTLTVHIKHVDLIASKWQPAFVGHAENGDEIGVWDLRSENFPLGLGTGGPVWTGSEKGVKMPDFGKATPKSSSDAETVVLPYGAMLRLSGGTLAFAVAPKAPLIVKRKKNGTEVAKGRYSTAVVWNGLLVDKSGTSVFPTNRKGEQLRLKIGGTTVSMSVTNVAKVVSPTGLEHFDQYYTLMDNGHAAR